MAPCDFRECPNPNHDDCLTRQRDLSRAPEQASIGVSGAVKSPSL